MEVVAMNCGASGHRRGGEADRPHFQQCYGQIWQGRAVKGAGVSGQRHEALGLWRRRYHRQNTGVFPFRVPSWTRPWGHVWDRWPARLSPRCRNRVGHQFVLGSLGYDLACSKWEPAKLRQLAAN
jgi:hypothetical protein